MWERPAERSRGLPTRIVIPTELSKTPGSTSNTSSERLLKSIGTGTGDTDETKLRNDILCVFLYYEALKKVYDRRIVKYSDLAVESVSTDVQPHCASTTSSHVKLNENNGDRSCASSSDGGDSGDDATDGKPTRSAVICGPKYMGTPRIHTRGSLTYVSLWRFLFYHRFGGVQSIDKVTSDLELAPEMLKAVA
ncbi:MAG: hypothetical protein J3Q66DRAFT_363698 [Benniella sp.]|nr:MAG: hypothetical protein J3Q66DRAFT_363698 [Benniella sp.]